MQYIDEEDVKFIRLAFCDVFGNQKNVSIMPGELHRAFTSGIAFDASAIAGFRDEVHSDLFLHPDPSTLSVLPWRPEHGRVVRMYCTVKKADGTIYENDTRHILEQAIDYAKSKGYSFYFGSEMEFYLFKLDEDGEPTKIPHDKAGYMDIAPNDKGENVRREICLTLEQMGIYPECSHHEMGPGQNEIDFRYSDALTAADNAATFRTVVQTVTARNGLHADFTPKPLKDEAGSGLHINMSVKTKDGSDPTKHMIAGILNHITEMTAFLNPTEDSYRRLGVDKAPKYISWSHENRSHLIRIPHAEGEYKRIELRSPDSMTNPYIAFALLIYASIDGIEKQEILPEADELNLFKESAETLRTFEVLPQSLREAMSHAEQSAFIHDHLPETLVGAYCK